METEKGTPCWRATAAAVAGSSCIMPRAPDGLRARGSKLDSWRVIAKAKAGSARPYPAGAVRTG